MPSAWGFSGLTGPRHPRYGKLHQDSSGTAGVASPREICDSDGGYHSMDYESVFGGGGD